MQPDIVQLEEKKLIGNKITMSFVKNKTADLWRSFMPRRKDIRSRIDDRLYSVEIYPAGFFNNFSLEIEFTKWAAVEVKDLSIVPDGLEKIVLPGGLYAIFLHKGPASQVQKTYQYILNTWLSQNNKYALDDKPHFAIMGDKYKNEDPDSEEELWIPLQERR